MTSLEKGARDLQITDYKAAEATTPFLAGTVLWDSGGNGSSSSQQSF